MLPSLKTIGVAWNPAESNSLVFVKKGRALAPTLGLTLLEANADTTAAVGDAVNSLIARGAQAIWVGGDNTVIAGISSAIATLGWVSLSWKTKRSGNWSQSRPWLR